MRKKILLIITIICAFAVTTYAAESRILISPFYSDSPDDTTALMTTLTAKAPAQTAVLDSSEKMPELPVDAPLGIESESFIKELSKIASAKNSEYILSGNISRSDDIYTIHAVLVNADKSTIAYRTKISVFKSDQKYDPVPDLWGRIQLSLEGKSFPVNNLKVSKGSSVNEIAVEWDAVPDCTEYLVYRGNKIDGAFELAAKTKRPALYDTKSAIGLKLFYYVHPVINGVRLDHCEPLDGYRKPALPKGEDLRKMLGTFTKPIPHLTSDAAKIASDHIAIIRPLYQNRTKLNLTLYIVQGYIQKKELFVYRNIPEPVIDTQKRIITLVSADGSYSILFNNNTFFTKVVKLNDDELTKRLLRNAVFFCVPKGIKEVTDDNGVTRYINEFEAIGMCTQYHKESRDWQDTTMVFGTSNKELKAKMDEARRKMEGRQY